MISSAGRPAPPYRGDGAAGLRRPHRPAWRGGRGQCRPPQGALDAIELDGARRLCLDMGDLAFLDVAALRELTSFTQRVRQSGRHVEAHGARPSLHRTAGVLGVDDLLGLTPATQ